jgi:alpha/beta superfamily hydrolase
MMDHFFLGEDCLRLFGIFSRPAGRPRIGLVFCPPLGEEMVSTYARMARWSKDLADRGVAVLRYHPRGTGESDGGSEEFTLKSSAEDAATAVEWMRKHCGAERVGILGLRFGASAAVHAMAQADFMVLWSPVVNLRLYFRDLLRMRISKEVMHLGADRVRVTAKDLTSELEAGRTIDLLGYETSAELSRQMTSSETWPVEPPARDVLWLGPSSGKAQAEAIASRWRDRGSHVDLRTFREPAFWEDFSLDFPHQSAELTLEWMGRQEPVAAGAR